MFPLVICLLIVSSLGLCYADDLNLISTPAVTMFPNASNVFGRAFPGQSSGVVRFLGKQDSSAHCEAACLAYIGTDGTLCHSFSYHALDFPQPTFQGACFAVADHSWDLHACPDSCSPGITTGRVESKVN